jgi:hypothetical protein
MRSDKRTNRMWVGTDAHAFQFDILEQGVFEILHLVRFWRNRGAPVNQIPPEILTLIPGYWDKYDYDRDRDLIALTHVCRAWRDVFTSRPSLWTDLGCVDEDKTRVYLERSKSLPIDLSLYPDHRLAPHRCFSEIIPHAIGRLRSLTIDGTLECLQEITAHLSRSAPLLEKLHIRGGRNYEPHWDAVVTPTLFNGDLSSLRELCLESVHTKLPWRNMTNLTSFNLFCVSSPGVSVKKLLDFFAGAPHLRKINLHFTIQTSIAQNGRLVSLAYLKKMKITGGGGRSASSLLNHLLVPAGARLTIGVDLSQIKDHPPKFLENLRNLPDFTTIQLSGGVSSHIQFSGPNGQVKMIPSTYQVDKTGSVLESLGQFDTSRVEELTIDRGNSQSSDLPCRALLPMKHLHTLTLRHCASSHIFVHALHPNMSSSGVVVCPKLEGLVIVLDGMPIDMTSVIGVVAARASRGAKLKFIRIIGRKSVRTEVLELKKHVPHVEYGPEVDEANDDGGDIDEDGDEDEYEYN